MNAAALAHDAFAPIELPGRRVGLVFAIIAHVLLVAALAWSVSWKTSEPEGVVAELWAALPQTAAPRVAPPPPPPPVRERVEALKPSPRPDTSAREQADAQIAIERAAREKARLDEAARAEAARRDEKRRADAAERDKQRLAQAERDKQRQADEQQAKKQEQLKARQDEARAAAAHDAQVRRMMAQAGSSDTAVPGNAARTAGPSSSYAGRIKARIKPNIVLTASVAGNPTAEVEVRVAPDGTIVGRKITKSSGSVAWDEAVLRAIDKTEILPKDTDGRVQPVMTLALRPLE